MNLLFRVGTFLIFLAPLVGCGKKASIEATPAPELTPNSSNQSPGIEGTYLITGVEMWGEKISDEKIAKDSELDRTVKINKDQIQFKFGKWEVVRYKLDPSKSPAEIDLFPEDAGKKANASYGIYKVDGDRLTMFLMGAKEPQLRPREFVTVDPFKEGKAAKDPEKQVGGALILTLKKVSNDTTFIVEAPPKPKPPEVDLDGPVVAELTKKGFVAEKQQYGKFPGVDVTVPSTLPLEALKELNGKPRIRVITFRKKGFLDPDHPVTPEAIQSLNKLEGLTGLVFEYCPKITVAAFSDLSRFPLLNLVRVISSPVDDAMTEELAKVKSLEVLDLDGKSLTDKSLANLAKIKSLKTLWLHEAKVTAAGIKSLNALTNLEFLALQGMPVADSALSELNFPKLEILNLALSEISDDGVSKLPVLPQLRNLTLGGSPKFTDAGLKHLLKQPNLESLTLLNSKISKEAIEAVQKAKPKLLITSFE